jgi:hypothetical protein
MLWNHCFAPRDRFGRNYLRRRSFTVGEAYGLKCGVENPSLRVFPAQVGDGTLANSRRKLDSTSKKWQGDGG